MKRRFDDDDEPTGVVGTLAQMPVPDIVQVLAQGARTAVVEVRPKGGTRGSFGTRGGRVVFARCDDGMAGDEAFMSLCQATRGFFRIRYEIDCETTNVDSDVMFLLLEAARRHDETSRPSAPAPPVPTAAAPRAPARARGDGPGDGLGDALDALGEDEEADAPTAKARRAQRPQAVATDEALGPFSEEAPSISEELRADELFVDAAATPAAAGASPFARFFDEASREKRGPASFDAPFTSMQVSVPLVDDDRETELTPFDPDAHPDSVPGR